jgi:four helix bundle protein
LEPVHVLTGVQVGEKSEWVRGFAPGSRPLAWWKCGIRKFSPFRLRLLSGSLLLFGAVPVLGEGTTPKRKENIMNRTEPNREEHFDFEKLIVYKKAMALRKLIRPLTSKPPRKSAKLVDELDRAVDSILLNVPEGCGRPRFSKSRREFNRKALGSAKEAASALNLLGVKGQIPVEMACAARRLLLEIVKMLEVMARE